jgi:hypothetical protein
MESLNHASHASNSHLYLPLAETDEIRLLSLQPGHANETVKCTLQHTKLKSFPRYEALSYMWGPKEYRTIELDGKPYAVTENLWQALIHLRLEQETRTMWIDAICINQGDGSERNHQVSLSSQLLGGPFPLLCCFWFRICCNLYQLLETYPLWCC